ncbi:DUF4388 domain-containing protein [bacterium]|nr:DUF4388 domain-containing protein [bacterium]
MDNPIYSYSIPVLFKTILKSMASGELVVKGDDLKRTLYFINGKLVFAKTTLVSERLGDILFNTGEISASYHNNIGKMIASTDEKIGQLLVRKKVVKRRDIFRSLLYQVRIIGIATLLMDSGEWDFVRKEPNIPNNTRFPIELPGMITEGVRKLDDLNVFKNKFGNLSPKCTDISKSANVYLTADEFQLYEKLSNFQNQSHHQIISSLQIGEEFYWEKIVLFFLINILDFVPLEIDPGKKLNNQDKKEEYDSKGMKEQVQGTIEESNQIVKAKRLFLQARKLYKEKKFWEAAAILDKVVKIDNSRAKYYYNLGLCQVQVHSLEKEAEENFKKAAAMQPWNADPVYAIGILYQKANLKKLSEKYFRKALEINIDHTKAGRMIKDIETSGSKKGIKSSFSVKKK